MNLTDNEVLELSAICHALVDGIITDAERVRLESWLTESDEARRYYVRMMGLSASLCSYASELQSGVVEPAAKIVRPALWRWAIGTLAAAASVALAFWLGGLSERIFKAEPGVAEADSDETVARLSGARDCEWIGEAPKVGDELRRAQRVQLSAGLAEITFDSGARITVQGPAALELTSAWEAALQHGSLRATVPTEAIGFRISNPEVDVVDLGTEFTMVADAAGGTEVYVVKGAVEVASRAGSDRARDPVVLREKQARRFAKNGSLEVTDRPQKIERLVHRIPLDRLTRPASYLHWSFDETSGALARADSISATAGVFDARLSVADGDLSDAVWTSGRWQGALSFDGKLQVKAPLPVSGTRGGRTIAFWVRASAEDQFPEAGSMLAWPLGGKEARVAELAWNRDPTHGPLGALRTRVGRGAVVGSAPVRDGRWHHVAIVFVPKAKPEGAQQIKQYIDGRLDTLASKHNAKKHGVEDREVSVAILDELLIGVGAPGDRLRGLLDEIFIADRPLTPYEIRHLMVHNAPAVTEMLAAD